MRFRREWCAATAEGDFKKQTNPPQFAGSRVGVEPTPPLTPAPPAPIANAVALASASAVANPIAASRIAFSFDRFRPMKRPHAANVPDPILTISWRRPCSFD